MKINEVITPYHHIITEEVVNVFNQLTEAEFHALDEYYKIEHLLNDDDRNLIFSTLTEGRGSMLWNIGKAGWNAIKNKYKNMKGRASDVAGGYKVRPTTAQKRAKAKEKAWTKPEFDRFYRKKSGMQTPGDKVKNVVNKIAPPGGKIRRYSRAGAAGAGLAAGGYLGAKSLLDKGTEVNNTNTKNNFSQVKPLDLDYNKGQRKYKNQDWDLKQNESFVNESVILTEFLGKLLKGGAIAAGAGIVALGGAGKALHDKATNYPGGVTAYAKDNPGLIGSLVAAGLLGASWLTSNDENPDSDNARRVRNPYKKFDY